MKRTPTRKGGDEASLAGAEAGGGVVATHGAVAGVWQARRSIVVVGEPVDALPEDPNVHLTSPQSLCGIMHDASPSFFSHLQPYRAERSRAGQHVVYLCSRNLARRG